MSFDAYCCTSKLASKISECSQHCIYYLEDFKVEEGVYAKNGYELSSFNLDDSGIRPMVLLVLHVHDPCYEDMQEVWYTLKLVCKFCSITHGRPYISNFL